MPTTTSLRILLSRDAADRFGTGIAACLKSAGHELVRLEDIAPGIADAEVDAAFLTKDITGQSSKTRLSPALERFFDLARGSSRLKWVHTHSAGADRPIYPELLARGVKVSTSSGLTAHTVAASAVCGLLCLARRFPDLMDAQRRKSWEPLVGERAPRDLKGQTAIVVGLGPIGTHIARALSALALRVVGVRRTAQPCEGCDEVVTYAGLNNALPRADWLILACPLTETTRGLIDAAALAKLPAGAQFVNVARGEVVVERDLIAVLQSGGLAGAYLDVFENEPLDPASPLWSLPNVIVTPHAASHSTGYYDNVGELFLDNLRRWREGTPLRNDANRYNAN